MKNNAKWKWLSLFITTLFMLSVMPEIRLLGLVIDAIGLDMLLLLLEGYVLVFFTYLHQTGIKPAGLWLVKQLKKRDPYFFIPSRAQTKQCPALLSHGAPGFISCLTAPICLALFSV